MIFSSRVRVRLSKGFFCFVPFFFVSSRQKKKREVLLPSPLSTDCSFSPSPFNTTPPPRPLSDICRPTAGSLRLRRMNKMTHHQLIQLLIDTTNEGACGTGYNCIALHGCKCGTCASSIGVIWNTRYTYLVARERVRKKRPTNKRNIFGRLLKNPKDTNVGQFQPTES